MLIRRTVPGTGRLFSSSDYDSGELVTHAQSTTWISGFSRLAEALNRGVKVHNALAATMLGITYDEFQARAKEKTCKDARQAAKPGNFGLPGLMGPVRLVLQQRAQGPDTPCANGPTMVKDDDGNLVPGYKGLRLCLLMQGASACGIRKTTTYRDEVIPPTCVRCIECATRLKEIWLKQWPENHAYFDYVKLCVNNGMVIDPKSLARWPWLKEVFTEGQRLEPGQIMQHVTGRLRGKLTPTACANGFFQALLADACKAAHRRVTRECYDRTVRVPDMAYANSKRSRFAGGESPLYGSRIPVFAHDELLGDHPESVAHEAAIRTGEIMVDELRWHCPDVAEAAKVDPCLMKKWLKGAVAVWQRGGEKPADEYDRLIPWEPKAAA